jgi:hypothetical protein
MLGRDVVGWDCCTLIRAVKGSSGLHKDKL